ncbi:glutamate--cysteine ligase [Ornithinimicrobium sp. F0845]|uniref:carboxylate-amine ligase n=1 Tax=Ornithinimicrobium sp. F0845 TaxID=2926412 RepID=UPI001FF16AE5|nr:glutamate--cysteine ligase [Ornithinimicrobium sp. F0845]MCK0113050.1 glutamate--cysteine ligase [Ornithinimicrobium sp. F0845]
MRTVGVEEEMLLVDMQDGRAQSVQGQLVLRSALQDPGMAPAVVEGALEGELQREQVETQTAPSRDLAELEEQVRYWRGEAAEAARAAHCRVAAIATSPLPSGPSPAAGERYAWIREHYQLLARQHLSCGLHVHVAIDSDEEGVGVVDRVRVWLPVLLALSANSPFAHGEDAGFQSWRNQMMTRWPSSGPTDLFGSPEVYHALVQDMTATGVLLDKGMIYSDARLSHHYPTVELRTADVCTRVEDTVLIAALSRALVETAAAKWAAGTPAPQVPSTLIRLASFQASRHGLKEDLLDPLTSRPRPAWEVVDDLLVWVRPALESAGDLPRVESALGVIRQDGTGADLQRLTLERTGQLVDVVAQAVRVTAGQE